MREREEKGKSNKYKSHKFLVNRVKLFSSIIAHSLSLPTSQFNSFTSSYISAECILLHYSAKSTRHVTSTRHKRKKTVENLERRSKRNGDVPCLPGDRAAFWILVLQMRIGVEVLTNICLTGICFLHYA